MAERWREAVDDHRDTLEALAERDGPLADDARRLLEEADLEETGNGARA